MNIERRIQQLEQDADARFDSAFHPYLNLVIEEGVWMAEHAPPAFEVWREALAAGRMYELTEDEQATLSAVQWPDSLRAKAERIAEAMRPFDAIVTAEKIGASFARWHELQEPA